MFWLTKWVAAPAMAVAFMLGPEASEAKADHGGVRVQLGRFGLSIGSGYGGYYPSYGYRSHYGYYPRYHSYHHGHHGHHGYYHDTTHYDYHPPQIIPHGNHYDYMPGHYDLHHSGHWHH